MSKSYLAISLAPVLIVTYLVVNTGVVLAGNKMKAPFSESIKRPVSVQNFYTTSATQLIWKGLITFYSKIISPADGARSPSYPTGSMYGKMAVKKHGFFLGIILTADRLLHESDLPLTPTITVYQKNRFNDPLEFNTFWWDIEKP